MLHVRRPSSGAVVLAWAIGLSFGLSLAWAADPIPHSADQSTIDFVFADNAPLGTLLVRVGVADQAAWQQPIYPGAHIIFTLPPGRYPIELPGQPALVFVQAPSGTASVITVVRAGASAPGTRSAGYAIAGEQRIPPDQLPDAHRGAAPLYELVRELGPSLSFAMIPTSVMQPSEGVR
jgi:hypothetical protein